MALSYDQSAALMTDMAFRGRVKVACLKYAGAIMIEDSTVPANNTRQRWANSCYANPDGTATMIQPPTVMDPAVQAAGATIDDTALQASVEGVVNKMM